MAAVDALVPGITFSGLQASPSLCRCDRRIFLAEVVAYWGDARDSGRLDLVHEGGLMKAVCGRQFDCALGSLDLRSVVFPAPSCAWRNLLKSMQPQHPNRLAACLFTGIARRRPISLCWNA